MRRNAEQRATSTVRLLAAGLCCFWLVAVGSLDCATRPTPPDWRALRPFPVMTDEQLQGLPQLEGSVWEPYVGQCESYGAYVDELRGEKP